MSMTLHDADKPRNVTTFIADPDDSNRVFNPDNEQSLLRSIRNMPNGEALYAYYLGKADPQYRTDMHFQWQTGFCFRGKVRVFDKERIIRVVFEKDDIDGAYRTSKALLGSRVPSLEDFHQNVLPAVRDAVICLENLTMASSRTGLSAEVEGIP